ncbi:MAG: hypothetical protein M5U35_08825 [Roseovarius sp.]|nr:hypothetical protein [Roseovarius sp.]
MKVLTMTMTAAVLGAGMSVSTAGAETLQSANLEAELTRRAVSMTSKEGATIAGEQVHVTMRRRDGAAIGAGDLGEYVAFAEQAACGTRTVLVSLMIGVEAGAGRYEVLCARGE